MLKKKKKGYVVKLNFHSTGSKQFFRWNCVDCRNFRLIKARLNIKRTLIFRIDVAVIRKLKNAIDACFDKCEMLNQAENTITNVDYLWSYSLHLYKFSKHTEMMAAATTSSQPVQVFGQR